MCKDVSSLNIFFPLFVSSMLEVKWGKTDQLVDMHIRVHSVSDPSFESDAMERWTALDQNDTHTHTHTHTQRWEGRDNNVG